MESKEAIEFLRNRKIYVPDIEWEITHCTAEGMHIKWWWVVQCNNIISISEDWKFKWLIFWADQVINSPELRQCLSQSGTTWQWGECIIILNK